jgi:hypothetical protein
VLQKHFLSSASICSPCVSLIPEFLLLVDGLGIAMGTFLLQPARRKLGFLREKKVL